MGKSLDEDESAGRPFTCEDAQRLERLEEMMLKLMGNNRGGGRNARHSTPNPYLGSVTPRPSMKQIKSGPDVVSIDPEMTPLRLRTRPDSVDSIPTSDIEKRRLSMKAEDLNIEHFNVTKVDGSKAQIANENGAWMIDPRNPPRMFWDICLLMPFLIYLLFSMPFRICFQSKVLTP